jgi:hypothetical protein
MTTLTISENESKFDLGDIFTSVVASVANIVAPSPAAVEAAGNDLVSFVWGVAAPLLTAPNAEVFDTVLKGSATAKNLRQFEKLYSGRAAKKWVKKGERDEKVRALKPDPAVRDPLAVQLRDDVSERMELLVPRMRAAYERSGLRLPKKEVMDALDARVIVTAMPIFIAAAPGQRFSQENLERAWSICTESMLKTAQFLGIGTDKLLTKFDAQRAAEGEARAAAREAARDEHMRQLRELEDEAAYGYWSAE